MAPAAFLQRHVNWCQSVMTRGFLPHSFGRYNANLNDAKNMGIKKSTVNGAGMGLIWFVMFGAMALAFWVGSQFYFDGKYTAGTILIVST